MAKTTALTQAKQELQRLQDAIKRYEEHQTPEARAEALRTPGAHHHESYGSCPERAAVKRASLDVTRVLARLRREAGGW